MTRIVPKDDGPEVRRISTIGLVANLGLMIFKFAVGIWGHSQALIADAIHSASDLVADAAVIVGSKFWNAPPDSSHQHGHRRIETLISIAIGIAVIAVGVFLAYESALALWHGEETHPEFSVAVAAAVSVLVKELLFRYTRQQGKKLRSLALEATAQHHRSDALSSAPVLVAVLLALVFPKCGFFDSLGALIVSFLIMHSGYEIIRPGIHQVADGAPDEAVCKRLQDVALAVPGVLSIHRFRARIIGSDLEVTLHIVVSPKLSLLAAHDLSELVERKLIESGENVVDALVHIDPYSKAREEQGA